MRLRLAVLATCFAGALAHAADASGIAWREWSTAAFDEAKRDRKYVVLDLEAVWCHWCHVMDKETYGNPEVVKLVREKFIAVRVDQDSRPDISRRYEDYGWPATIFFDPSGRAVVKRSGFIPVKEMVPLLRDVASGKAVEREESDKITLPSTAYFSKERRARLESEHRGRFDRKLAGWGTVHKFLFGDTEDYSLRRAWLGDADEATRAKRTLTAALALVDPVWGGVYQYSVEDWKEPHFEKIAEAQAKNLHLYSAGYALFSDAAYLEAARSIHRFLTGHLRDPAGAFYTSQDADLVRGEHAEGYFKLGDAERRNKGIPAIDKHVYARENGWYVAGLCDLYAVSGDQRVLDDAVAAVRWIEANRGLAKGGFRHDEKDAAGPYLGDTLEMGNAYLQLYQVTAGREWLEKARLAGAFVRERFSHRIAGKPAGYVTSVSAIRAGASVDLVADENVRAARFFNLLSHYTGEKAFKEAAEQAMLYLASPEVAQSGPPGGVLLAEQELSTRPVHITVVGAKGDEEARALFAAARSYPVTYKRVEWWDRKEGSLPNADVKYPDLKKAAAFACKEGRCSLPVTRAADLHGKIDRLYKGGT